MRNDVQRLLNAGLFAYFVALAPLANSFADELPLASDHGYVLLKVTLPTPLFVTDIGERELVIFENYDTGESFTIRLRTPNRNGGKAKAQLKLLSAPKGNYYLREVKGQNYYRPKPRTEVSASDIFGVMAGAVNYAGDWMLVRGEIRGRWAFKTDVEHNLSTIEESMTEFPVQLQEHEVYVSYLGREAISLIELAKIMSEQSGSEDE